MKEKGRFLKQYRGNECLNCRVPLDIIDRYCHNCGQINTTKKLSFKDFFDEFFASIFSYDSRLRHTMSTLLFNPGKISKDYIEGKRIKYANPFRFYLSVSIIFFIINGLFIDFERFSADIEDDVTKGKEAIEKAGINEIEKTIALDSIKEHINQQLDASEHLSPQGKKIINNQITKAKGTSWFDKEKTEEEVVYYKQTQIDTMGFIKKATSLWSMYTDHYEKTGQKSAYRALNELNHNKSPFNKYVYHRAIKTSNIDDTYGRELLEFIFNKLPFIIFFFLPFFALAIWFLYIRKSYNYMEHLVFTFHTQTMFFILIGIAILLDQIFASSTTLGVVLLIFLFYLYKAMRKFYNQGRVKTIVKFLLVNVLFFILAVAGSVITITGSIFIF
ncbi:DUF3667 domain-containing protein [Aquimarina mytili]|uniref:DUF3667 domain-containing protein n=1 Tax=Aquimarina mytili TaxID=874423 RepID=A0A936ZWS5_9FLAO|nr:DUF3667 domain-containing protein [Aquimarina mytili]MBL0683393.1 DUF3667 domain-containing protein [Aquimarina mytili]